MSWFWDFLSPNEQKGPQVGNCGLVVMENTVVSCFSKRTFRGSWIIWGTIESPEETRWLYVIYYRTIWFPVLFPSVNGSVSHTKINWWQMQESSLIHIKQALLHPHPHHTHTSSPSPQTPNILFSKFILIFPYNTKKSKRSFKYTIQAKKTTTLILSSKNTHSRPIHFG